MQPFDMILQAFQDANRRFARHGIRTQITAFVVLLLITCSSFAITVDVHSRIKEDHAATVDAATKFSHFIAMAAESHLEYMTYVDLQKLIDDAVSERRVDYLALETGTFDGLEMEAFQDQAAKTAATNTLIARAYIDKTILTSSANGWVHVARPLSDRRKVVGALLVGMKTKSIGEVAQSIIVRQVMVMLPIFLFALGIVIIVANKVIWPLQQMTKAAEEMALGKLDLAVQAPPYREIGQLSKAFRSMSQRVNAGVARIRERAFRDDLTQLPNRVQFEQSLTKVMGRCDANGKKLAVVFINVVDFKRVNDTLGHDRGDRLLVELSGRLKKLIDAFNHSNGKQTPGTLEDGPHCGSLVARFEADGFSVLIPGVEDGAVPLALSRTLQAALAEPVSVADTTLSIDSVIGISIYPDHGKDTRTVLRAAELALYHARRERQERIMFFSSQMDEEAQQSLHLENDLRQAIATNALSVMFQPKIDLKTRRVVGAEALARWQHPSRGLVPPTEFIPIAERSALILTLGEWVMQRSMEAAVLWLKKGFPISVAVNVSVLELEQPNFASRVRRQLAETGLPPHLLEIEVTETFAVSDASPANAQMEPLQADGVRFAIDDFGTGYSNLSQLKRASFDVFKIDRSFTSKMNCEPEARAIVQTIIAMADRLNYGTVAEGVETEAEAQTLQECGCMVGQGYLFGKPMPLARFMNYIRNAQSSVTPIKTVSETIKSDRSA